MVTCNHAHTVVRYSNPTKLSTLPINKSCLELYWLSKSVDIKSRHYIEGAKKITCITDHATLRHLLTTEDVNALIERRFALWSDIISPFIGTNDEGESTFEILYRKGTENDSDALSRRPDLHHEIVAYEDLVQEKDLEIGNEFFSNMYHMQVDKDFMQQIVPSYSLDLAFGGTSIPRGTQLNDNDGLYYFGDKVCIPKNPSIINQLIYEAHNAQGHFR